MNFENLVVLQGRLTKDPELKSFGGQGDSSGKYVRFTLAVNRNYTDKHTGQHETDFLYCVAWGHSAEIFCKYGFKDKKIGITGTLRSSSYTDKDTDKKMSKMEINVDSVGFPESKAAEKARANERQQQYNGQQYGDANGDYYNNGYNAFPQADPNNGYANNNSFGNNGYEYNQGDNQMPVQQQGNGSNNFQGYAGNGTSQ